jgi:nickel-type superoxide dismutase maturation protease
MVGNFGLMVARVQGESMAPAYHSGDLVLIRKTRKAKRNNIVIAHRPDQEDLLIIKRVVTITNNGYWLQGDNSEFSDDSRLFGEVPKELIKGIVLFKYWPLFTN